MPELLLTFLYGFAGVLMLRVSLAFEWCVEKLFLAVVGVLLLLMAAWRFTDWFGRTFGNYSDLAVIVVAAILLYLFAVRVQREGAR